MKVLEIQLSKIVEPQDPSRIQPSDSSIAKMANSISKVGLINPITVRVQPAGKYEIVAGHRRFLACKSLNLKTIACSVMSKEDKITDAVKITENMERKQLTDFEGIMAMANYATKHNLSISEFCEIFGINKATATKYITLASAPDDIKIQLHNGVINMSHAEELMHVKDTNDRINFTRQTIEYKWSSAQLKQNISIWQATKDWKKYESENKETLDRQEAKVVSYIECQMCNEQEEIENVESVTVCPQCREAIETARLKLKIARTEKKEEQA